MKKSLSKKHFLMLVWASAVTLLSVFPFWYFINRMTTYIKVHGDATGVIFQQGLFGLICTLFVYASFLAAFIFLFAQKNNTKN